MNKNIITKSIFSTAIIAAIATGASAQQLPSTFNYQAVVNADDGSPVAAKKITVEVSILQGNDCENNPGCPVLWQELHYPTTSDFGLFSIEIGASSATNTYAGSQANYSTIDWLDVSQGYYYLKVRADFGESENLNSLSDLGTTKFSAVPYSLVAQKADFATSATSANTITPDANDKIKNKLAQLADVDVTTVSAGEVLAWDGTKWINTVPAAQGASTLKELTDTDYGTPTDKDVLMYNGTSNKWESKGLDLKQSLNDLTDVTTATLENGQILTYNSTSATWKNQAITLSTLSGVNISSPTANQVLTFDGTNWINQESAQWTADANGIHTPKNVGIGRSAAADKLLVIQGKPNGENATTSFDGDGIDMSHGHIALGGKAEGLGSIAIRQNSKATGIGSVAIGDYVETSGENSMALGFHLTNTAPNSLVIGTWNNKSAKGLFEVGGGIDEDSRSSIFCIKKVSTGVGLVTILGSLEASGTVSGNVTSPSDRRLKTNITPLEKSLDKVMKLNGVTFNWDKSVKRNANASTALQYGFIAQEIEKVIPELVSEDSDGYKTVNYIGVIPVLTQAMQEQQKEIEQLKDENKKLNETIEALLKRVEALEKK